LVAGYEPKQGYPDPAEALAVLAAHGRDETPTVVDLGTGTGRFALAAAGRFGQVTAVDSSPAMLELLRRRGRGDEPHLCAGGVPQLPARRAARRRGLHPQRPCRMLRPGGVLRLHDLISDVQPSQADTVFRRWLEGAADDPARGYTRADLAEHIRTEHSTFRWPLEPMLAAAGLEIVTADFSSSVYGAYTCRKR
jgi:SAM-dependent methyltransferase